MLIFNINKEEKYPAIILMLMFFCIIGASITASSARDTFFLTQYDKSLLPLMFAAVSVVMVLSVTIYNRLSARLDLIKMIILTSLFFCCSIFIILQNLNGLVIPLFYVWTDVIIAISILQFWMLAGEIFNPRQAKRIFSLIGIGGSIAGISAGYFIKPFVKQNGTESLLVPTIFFLAMVALLATQINSYREKTISNDKISNTKTEKSQKNIKIIDSYLKTILIMVTSAAICSRIIEYQFKITAANTYPNSEDLAIFFGNYYMLLNGCTLIMQFFLTSIILKRFGILAGLVFLPIGLAIGSFSFLIFGGITSVLLSRLIDQTFKFSIQSTTSEILWTPIKKEKARKAKPIIDSSFKSIAEGCIGIIIYLIVIKNILPNDKIYILSIPVLLITFLWLWNNFYIKNRYVKALEKAINHRQLNLENVQFDVTNNHIVQTINNSLNEDNLHKQIFTIDLIKDLEVDIWKETLNKILINGKPEIKLRIIKLALEKKGLIDENNLLALSKGTDEVAARALILNNNTTLKQLSSTLHANLQNDNGHIKAASAVCLLQIDKNNEKAKIILEDFLDVKDEKTTALALEYLQISSELLPKDTLITLLFHPSIEISLSALNIAGKRLHNDYLPAIISNLSNIKLAIIARETLLLYDDEKVLNTIEDELNKEDINKDLISGIVRCLGSYSHKKSLEMLRLLLTNEDLELSIQVSNSMMKIAKTSKLKNEFQAPYYEEIDFFSKQYLKMNMLSLNLNNTINPNLIREQISSDKKKIIHIMLKLICLKIPESPVDSHIKHIISKNDKDLPYILEFIDTSFEKRIRDIIIPIIDPEENFSKESLKHKKIRIDIDSFLLDWIESGNNWKISIALNYILKNKNKIINQIQWDKVPSNPIISEILHNQDNLNNLIPIKKYKTKKEPTMFSILEKTMLLKTVDLFQDIPSELLSQISQISKAKDYESGEVIFNEGDYGDSMFIVIEGEVSIQKNGKSIALLDKGSSLGEMALLDNETRSADATAKVDSVLLKINQDVFYELMEGNADIMKQIIRLLTSRIRDANSKLEKTLG